MAGQAVLGEAILKEIQAAEAEAAPTIEGLVAQHGLLVFRIAYSVLRNHHDAEDAAQECFLRVLKYGRQLKHVRNPKTWLARIAWTSALDRRPARVLLSLDDSPYSDQGGEELSASLPGKTTPADEHLAGQQMQQILERLIAALPSDLRRTLELSTVQELNSTEIGEILNIPENSVRTRLMRARKLLKEKLASRLEVQRHG
ncbi:MAG TPA: RNA polymerase sigma factor [Candidatus Angelobacter sp.]|nr:RNA polymerase sigma factor [Candidatus Angelobacter sp.]